MQTTGRVIKKGKHTLTFLTNEEALREYGKSVVFVGSTAQSLSKPLTGTRQASGNKDQK